VRRHDGAFSGPVGGPALGPARRVAPCESGDMSPHSKKERKMDSKKVGVIGTGRMGNAFAVNLLKAGHRVYVYDIDPKAVQNLLAQGAVLSASPAEMAPHAEFFLTSLPKNEIVEQTIIGPQGLLPKLNRGSVVIDLSTTLPRTTKAIAEALAQKEVEFLDAPVSGHAIGAKNATLTVMVGGNKEAFLRAREPIFEKLGKNIFYAGPTGAGQALKLVNNLLYNLNRLAMCEGLVLGAKAGIDPEIMCQAISLSTGGSYAIRSLPPDILEGNFEGRESSLNLACKTLKLITDFADEMNVNLLLGNLAKQLYNFMRLQGHGDETPSTVIQFYESTAGVKVRKS
jgi:3-hydroxyisobutyrate dehydrogenase-like beta-hydroxyacid dehydrogenase